MNQWHCVTCHYVEILDRIVTINGLSEDEYLRLKENKMTNIFVYGTLKKGECREHVLSGQTLLTLTQTAPLYTLYNLGSYPGLVEGGDTEVPGELWAIDDECLERLDEIEGVSYGLYRMGEVKLNKVHAVLYGEKVMAYFYCQSTVNAKQIGGWPVLTYG